MKHPQGRHQAGVRCFLPGGRSGIRQLDHGTRGWTEGWGTKGCGSRFSRTTWAPEQSVCEWQPQDVVCPGVPVV